MNTYTIIENFNIFVMICMILLIYLQFYFYKGFFQKQIIKVKFNFNLKLKILLIF